MRTSLSSLAILALAASAAAQANRWVDPVNGSNANPGTQAAPYQTINFANSAANPGDTIRLLPGVYGDEQGIVVLGDKDIQVVGAGIGVTVLRAHSTATVNVPTGFPNAPVATQQRPVVLVEGDAAVDLRGFTVDGNHALPASGRLTGIYYRNGADGVIADLEIRNCRANPLDGSQGPAGLVVRGDGSGDTSFVTLQNVHVYDFGKVGVAAFFDAQVQILNSRVVGADHVGTGGPAQNGIQYGYGAGGVIRRTHLADLFYDPASFVASGILAFDAGNLSVDDCSIANVEHAIYYYASIPTALNASIRRNRIVACDAGVYVDNVSGLSIVDNHLQLSLDQFANAGFSNTAGNTWASNSYSSYNGFGSYAIPGGGGNVDATPRRGVDLFDAPVATSLPAGHAGRVLAVAQLDGSGGSDFATADENAGLSLTVGLNSGGAFVTTNFGFAATGRPVGIAAAELNGAPGLDLAVLVQETTPTVGARVYTFANNGAGAFSLLGNQFLAGVQASALAAADVDGNSLADLAIANVGGLGGGEALLLTNLGLSFAVATLPSPGYFPVAVRGVAFADVNGDANQDLLVAEGNQASGRLHVFFNDGAGNFAAAGYSPLGVAVDPTAVGARDLDGDGDQDLVVTAGTVLNSTPGALTVLENLGAGAWRRSVYGMDYSANAVALGDVDDDGMPGVQRGDVAVASTDGNTLSLLGSYERGVGFAHGGIAVSGSQVTATGFGDFDGDAYLDLFYSNGIGGQVVVLPGRPSARTDYYGFAAEGYRAKVPYLGPVGAPGVAVQPNLTLGIELTNGREFTLGAIVGTFAPAAVLQPNFLQIDLNTSLLTFFAVTDITGRFVMNAGLAGSPSLRGMEVYFQAGVLDTVGLGVQPYLPGVALSQGMKLRLGW